jgi:hypothetical protein
MRYFHKSLDIDTTNEAVLTKVPGLRYVKVALDFEQFNILLFEI